MSFSGGGGSAPCTTLSLDKGLSLYFVHVIDERSVQQSTKMCRNVILCVQHEHFERSVLG